MSTLKLRAPIPVMTEENEHNPQFRRQYMAFSDLTAAQVKTLSFLAYILRGHNDMAIADREEIPVYVLHLLRSCPADIPGVRKELLVATRHIILTSVRTAFCAYLVDFIDEKVRQMI